MQREAKKAPRFSFSSLVSLLAIASLAYVAWQSGFIETAVAHLKGGHAHNDAERYAEMLSRSPECAPYRAAILNYAGDPGSEELDARVQYLFHKGMEAGCKRLDVE
jgi:hypothetical protein